MGGALSGGERERGETPERPDAQGEFVAWARAYAGGLGRKWHQRLLFQVALPQAGGPQREEARDCRRSSLPVGDWLPAGGHGKHIRGPGRGLLRSYRSGAAHKEVGQTAPTSRSPGGTPTRSLIDTRGCQPPAFGDAWDFQESSPPACGRQRTMKIDIRRRFR